MTDPWIPKDLEHAVERTATGSVHDVYRGDARTYLGFTGRARYSVRLRIVVTLVLLNDNSLSRHLDTRLPGNMQLHPS
jgi:hypothetical protein